MTPMEVYADISLQSGDAAQREQAKMKLYVLFQSIGWTGLLGIDLPGDSSWAAIDQGVK